MPMPEFKIKEENKIFKQKCFIHKNTKGLHNKLYNLGDRKGKFLSGNDNGVLLCADYSIYRSYDDKSYNSDSLIKDGYIDCGTNEELFLAIAALRDNSDYMQWFINNKTNEWYCHKPLSGYGDKYNADTIIIKSRWHKASVKELIEHLK